MKVIREMTEKEQIAILIIRRLAENQSRKR